MSQRFPPTPPWESHEVVLRGMGEETPFRDVLFSGDGDETGTPLRKMWLLQSHGWPEAKRVMRGKKRRKSGLIDRADCSEREIWILKCKPSCWRLYFCVFQEKHQIVYLHAACKRRAKRDPAECARACRIFCEHLAGPRSGRITRIPFPD